MNEISYFESCYECDSINLSIRAFLNENDPQERIKVTCYECGEEWEDILEKESNNE